MVLTNSQIQELLQPYGVPPTPGLAEGIRRYIDRLLRWNLKMSLTTVKDPAEIVRFHFGESIFASIQVTLEGSRLADVGSGAGFPGLPLAMVIPSLDVTLIESNSKKCAFLSEVIRELDIANATVFRDRMENLPSTTVGFDCVAARAVGRHEEFLAEAAMHLVSGGRVILWLGEQDSIRVAREPKWFWDVPIPIPGSERRFILVGSRVS